MDTELDPSLLARAKTINIEPIDWPALNERDIRVSVRRDDLIDTELSGNKFYKLHHNLLEAKSQGKTTVLSFGGAWSNHLYALAAAGRRNGIHTVGVVRGEMNDSAMLRDAAAFGMTLIFWSRQQFREYKSLAENSEALRSLKEQVGDFYFVPEGGSNGLGALGCKAISLATEQTLKGDFTDICMASGTGATLAGVAAGLAANKHAWGLSVLKGEGSMAGDISNFIGQLCPHDRDNWTLQSGYHGGGYAKLSTELLDFMRGFEEASGLLLDPVYTLKLCWGVEAMAKRGVWRPGSHLVLVHSGGLQGRRGYKILDA
jgi:1-aminocyclopropane-1-carboxylate deaminase